MIKCGYYETRCNDVSHVIQLTTAPLVCRCYSRLLVLDVGNFLFTHKTLSILFQLLAPHIVHEMFPLAPLSHLSFEHTNKIYVSISQSRKIERSPSLIFVVDLALPQIVIGLL